MSASSIPLLTILIFFPVAGAVPIAFFRRSAWEEGGPFDESLHHTMDYDYWLRLGARYAPARVRYLEVAWTVTSTGPSSPNCGATLRRMPVRSGKARTTFEGAAN